MRRLLTQIIAALSIIAWALLPAAQPSSARSVQPDSAWQDDFTSTALDPRWSWVNEDPAFWSLSEAPGFLRIKTQSGSWFSSSDAKNILSTPVESARFRAVTKVSMVPTENFHNAGFYIFQDPSNYAQLALYYSSGKILARFRVKSGGTVVYSQDKETALKTIFLRIEKEDNTYRGFFSADGANWTLVGEAGLELTNPKLGLNAQGGLSTAAVNADFDFVSYTPLYDYPVEIFEGFDAAPLDPRWTILDEIPAGWNLTAGVLQITGTNYGIYNPGGYLNNLFLTDAPSGRFSVMTQVNISPSEDHHNAALYLYEDADHYVRIARGFSSGVTASGGQVIGMRLEEGGVPQTNWIPFDHSGLVWLRIDFEGGTYCGYYNFDGVWHLAGCYQTPFQTLRIGIGADSGGSTTPVQASFSNVIIRRDLPLYLPMLQK